ncbi:Transferrin-like protein [Euroglyphus maynei]|uniref:Transferrin-like protein n=1 Tax=Euroglyphus maynei TaxID=6958 RepID=A0A1Y3BKA4_EURMA|nr:Transferrin-like protein [Euroglyphus maynei]
MFMKSQQKETLKYCTINKNELNKCRDWSRAVDGDYRFQFRLECIEADNKDHCMQLIETQKAHMVSAEPGEIYIAGRYHSLVPIVYEQYGPTNQTGYYAVAVVKANSYTYIQQPKDLRNKNACFSGVGQLAGWILPIIRLLELDLIDTIDCNNIIQNAANFFNESCAPNALLDKNNPIGTNPQKICLLCESRKCSGNDFYANFEGALNCIRNKGDVAFVKHTIVDQLSRINRIRRQDYQLLCPHGDRTSVDNYLNCNWGYVPPHAILVSSIILPEIRDKIQQFLLDSSRIFSLNKMDPMSPRTTTFNLFDSLRYNGMDFIFSEETVSLAPVDRYRQTFRGYFSLFNPFVDIENLSGRLRKCNVPNAKLCVVSNQEWEKCNNMKSAFRTNMLQPQLLCVQGSNTIDCMEKIQQGQADLTVLDAADIYMAGQQYNIEPIMAEQNNLNDSYYAVAIAKKADLETDLLYLKDRKSCHSGYRTAAGWVIPMSFLLSNSRMRSYRCNAVKAASQFFSKSCIPGVLAPEYHSGRSVWQYNNLCNLCHGNSYRFCRRDSSEPFYGDNGAFQCLVEGGGDVAFAKHTVIFENTNGINTEYWARNKYLDDFELLCRDGSRAEVQDYNRCNLGQVANNAIVTNKFKPFYEKEAYVTLFIYAQQFYGSKYSNEFTYKMFVSGPKYKNLIFQDSTVKLKPVPENRRDYRTYLGHEFMTAMSIVDCQSRNHAAIIRTSSIYLNNFYSFCSLFIITIFSYNHYIQSELIEF